MTRAIWYCGVCGRVFKAKPALTRKCRCPSPVIQLRPTKVTA